MNSSSLRLPDPDILAVMPSSSSDVSLRQMSQEGQLLTYPIAEVWFLFGLLLLLIAWFLLDALSCILVMR
jgi:hypothetical protein